MDSDLALAEATGSRPPPQAFDFIRALWRELMAPELQALAAMAHLPPATADLASWQLNAQELEALVFALKRAVLLGTRCALALEEETR